VKSKLYGEIERKLTQALNYYEINENLTIEKLRKWVIESRNPFNFLRRVIKKVKFESKVEVESLVRLLIDFWQYVPRFELGGLSPAEKIEGKTIPSSNYFQGEFPYSSQEVEGVGFFRDFLTFLKYIEEKGAKLTQRKNISLKDLREILNLFIAPIKMEERVAERVFRVRSEQELPYVEKIHILAELLRLVRKRKFRLIICKRAKESFDRLPLSIQFQLIWSTYWHHLNWSYFHPWRENIAEVLQKNREYVKELILDLDTRREEWINFSHFSKKLEKKLNLTWYDRDGLNHSQWIYSAIELVLIEEFKLFGLVEIKRKKDKERVYLEKLVGFRLTPLGKKVMGII